MDHDREVRIIADEGEVHTVVPKERFGDWASLKTVKFEGVTLCDSNAKGGMDYHYVYKDDVLQIPWDYKSDEVTIVVFRFEDGDTFGHSSGNWKVHKIFAKRSQAKKYMNEHNLQDIFNKQKGYFESFEDAEMYTIDFENQLLEEK
jgi:hypothetical protein